MSESDAFAIRPAMVSDVPAMAEIINGFAAKQIMLPRSQFQFYQHVRDFCVIEHEGEIIGCGALQFVWSDMAEIRSLAVKPEWQGKGLGRRLVECLLEEGRAHAIPRIFCLTYQDAFFARMGFHVIPRESLPHKIWGDCLNCPKYPDCDEIAMINHLTEE